MSELNKKYHRLKKILTEMKKVLVAYSGGVDSTFLLKVALDTLGRERVIAVTARSETYPSIELKAAKKMAEAYKARHIIIDSEELEIPGFKDNPPDRCYYCKKELFGKLRRIADGEGIKYILDGSNHDDLRDYRPGMKAAKEFGVRSPLMESGLKKDDIRKLSKNLQLDTWDKPSFACLSSRFPYGKEITKEKLRMVDLAENYLRKLGFKQLRVRYHEDIARIELGQRDMEKIFEERSLLERIVKRFKKIGYLYITLDLEGYQTGSMNKVLYLKK
ncbi:MAG TPA: ATP-dependent sacrificial sulfur transferase LarE [Nitrospinota bacterium]|nr:ATP-dependent sacrificial sulfur transferase LarE [Nitrospinota bacterium]